MTLQQWLSQHNYSVHKGPRAFQFETELGEARWVQVIDPQARLMRYITDLDVYNWINQQVKENNPLLSYSARNTWARVEKPS
jgi:hypothetical protein